MSDSGPSGRRASVSSSSSMDSWTLLNHHGNDCDNNACQTDDAVLDKIESVESAAVGDVVDEIVDSDVDCEPVERESSVSSSIENVDPQEFMDTSIDTIVNQQLGEQNRGDDLSLSDECEFLPPRPRLVVDGNAVRRLLDALSKAVNNPSPQINDQPRDHDISAGDDRFSEELPVNFVQMASNRIRNYIHTQDSRLNWKLSLLLLFASATVLGLGIGHFIGHTSTWLRRHRLGKQQIEQMKGLQDGLVSCLANIESNKAKFETELKIVKAELNRCRALEHESCSTMDKPVCPPNRPDVEQWTDCKTRLNHCHAQLADLQQDVSRKSSVNHWVVTRLEELRRGKGAHQPNLGDGASHISLQRARLQQKNAERRIRGLEHQLAATTSSLIQTQLELDQKILEESQWRTTLDDVQKTSTKLNNELVKTKAELQKAVNDLQKNAQPKNDANSGGNCKKADTWEAFYDILSQLKNSSKVSEQLTSYVDLLQNMTVNNWNDLQDETNDKINRMWNTLDDVRSKVQNNMDFFEYIKFDDADVYWDKAGKMGEEINSAVSKVVDQAVTMVHDNAVQLQPQVEQLIKDMGNRMSIFGVDFDAVHAAIDAAFIAADKPADPDFNPSPLPSSQFNPAPSSSDHVKPIYPTETAPNPTYMPTPAPTAAPTPPPSAAQRLWTGISQTIKSFVHETPEDETNDILMDTSNETEDERILEEMWRFRGALKKSSLDNVIGDDPADDYIDHLKYLTRRSARVTDSTRVWWKCQQQWWRRGSTAQSLHCTEHQHLWKWQVLHWLDARGFLAYNPDVRAEVMSWDYVPPQQKIIHVEDEHDDEYEVHDDEGFFEEEDEVEEVADYVDGEWVFERSEQRNKNRKEHRKSDWLFERSKTRHKQRMQAQKGFEETDWIFKRGKGRANQRKNHNKNRHQPGGNRGTFFGKIHNKVKNFANKFRQNTAKNNNNFNNKHHW